MAEFLQWKQDNSAFEQISGLRVSCYNFIVSVECVETLAEACWKYEDICELVHQQFVVLVYNAVIEPRSTIQNMQIRTVECFMVFLI